MYRPIREGMQRRSIFAVMKDAPIKQERREDFVLDMVHTVNFAVMKDAPIKQGGGEWSVSIMKQCIFVKFVWSHEGCSNQVVQGGVDRYVLGVRHVTTGRVYQPC